MHLVTAISTCNYSIHPRCCHVTRRPCHRATIPHAPCHTIQHCHQPHHLTVSPATKLPQPCRSDSWCAAVIAGVPPLHLVRRRDIWCATVTPGGATWHLVRLRDTWFGDVTFGAPPWHLVRHPDTWCVFVAPNTPPLHHASFAAAGLLCYLAYFTTNLRAVNNIFVPHDTVSRNFTIQSIARNSHEDFNGFFKMSIGFPKYISQYCAIYKSKISHNNEVNV